MARERCVYVLLLSVVFIVAAGSLRPESQLVNRGMDPRAFWARKASSHGDYDAVLAGDSRVYRGLWPRAIAESMPQIRVINFGFPGTGLSKAYLAAVEKRLDPASPRKLIVLGITPHALTAGAAQANGFLAERGKSVFDRWAAMSLGRGLSYLDPMPPRRLLTKLLGRESPPSFLYYQHFHPDGWVASRRAPEDPQEALEPYRKALEATRVSRAVVDELLDAVRRWTSQGIAVCGFRPPTTAAMVALENACADFDEAGFARAFRSAGGTWLSFDIERYHTYDGSHLREDSARQLSLDLAARLASLAAAHASQPARPPGVARRVMGMAGPHRCTRSPAPTWSPDGTRSARRSRQAGASRPGAWADRGP